MGGLTLSEIQPDRVAEARDKLLAGTFTRGKMREDKNGALVAPNEFPRTPATVTRYLATLSSLFSLAVKEWNLIGRNPVRDITKPREARGRMRFLSDDERSALLDACEASHWAPLRTLVLLAIATGARRGELVSLKWTDVDLKAGRALVRESKNDEPRVLPLVGKALEALRLLKLNDSAKSVFLFPNPNGLDAEGFYAFDSYWYKAVEKAGLDDFKFHDLRHTTASYLAQQGASLLEIAEVLGHKTLAMVKRYSHLTTSHKTTVVERMTKERGL